jgi:hypothetical protein
MEKVLSDAPGEVEKWVTPKNFLGYKSLTMAVGGE